jgi:DNA-binding MarR family transcriptional regulator
MSYARPYSIGNCGIRRQEPVRRRLGISNASSVDVKEIESLLARTQVVRKACDLDLLVFLHRHPRALLTSEQLAAFVGYDIKEIAKSLEVFLEAGFLERTQNPMHAARMYLLVLDGPSHDGIRDLLKLASTRRGRQGLLHVLDPKGSQPGNKAPQGRRRLLKIA